jgi:hypothetical protein
MNPSKNPYAALEATILKAQGDIAQIIAAMFDDQHARLAQQTFSASELTAKYFAQQAVPTAENSFGDTPDPVKATPARVTLLEEAMHIISHDRNAAYGDPEDNFQNIADYWNRYLTQRFGCAIVVTPQDVAMMMNLMKVARLATNPGHRDSLVDIAGYAGCAADCQEAASNRAFSANLKVDNNQR